MYINVCDINVGCQLGLARQLFYIIDQDSWSSGGEAYWLFVIYFSSETQQLQQFLSDFSGTNLLSVLGNIDYTHIPIRLTSPNAASYSNRKSFNFLALVELCDAKFQLSVEDRKSSGHEAFLVSSGKLAGLICFK